MSNSIKLNEVGEKVEKLELVSEEKEQEEEENEKKGENKEDSVSPTIEEKFPPFIGEDYVRLISNDNHEHYIRRELVETSKVIRDMLDVPGTLHNKTVYLKMVSSRILRQICNYLVYRKHYLDKEGEVEVFKVPQEDAEEIFIAAGFFEI